MWESKIRIDHAGYDFPNTFREPIWNRPYLASLQITMAESFDVQGRSRFLPLYDHDPGTWGPAEAAQLAANAGGWHCPVCVEPTAR
jgi:glucose-6-phosphate 1-dehydrogenase